VVDVLLKKNLIEELARVMIERLDPV